MSTLERIPPGARLAVIRLRSLGDCVLTTPALALLRQHRPDLQVAVVVEDRFAGVFEGVSETLPPSRTALFRWGAHAVLNFHGGTRSMGLVLASAAKIRAGFAHHPYSFLYNQKIPRAQEILGEERAVHTAEHLASAMFWLGVPRQEIPRAGLTSDNTPRPPRPYVVIHPFASRADKAWPVARFVEAAHQLKSRQGLDTVFLAGPGDDTTPLTGFEILSNAPLRSVKNAMAGASLFLGNDSGPAHIAAAFGIPVVVLFGPSNPTTWAPWKTESRVFTSSGPIDQISLQTVLAAAEAFRVKA